MIFGVLAPSGQHRFGKKLEIDLLRDFAPREDRLILRGAQAGARIESIAPVVIERARQAHAGEFVAVDLALALRNPDHQRREPEINVGIDVGFPQAAIAATEIGEFRVD